MRVNSLAEDYFKARYSFFKWRHGVTVINKIALACGMACVTGLLAQVKLGLPWTPVPITGQTFAVLLSGVILGRWWGGISQTIYVVLGVAALPWFSNLTGGFGVLVGPTGGYIVGFILASLFLGHFIDKYTGVRSFLSLFVLMTLVNFILIYVPGLLQLALWLKVAKGAFPSLRELLLLGAVPFIIGDLTKIAAAALFAAAITPKESFGDEADDEKASKC